MEEDTKYIGVRIPVSLYHKLKKIAHDKQTTLTEIAIESFKQYTSNTTPGLCPSCHTQNLPDSQYCQKCGSSLVPGVPESLIKYVAERDAILQDIDRVLETLEPYKPLIELTREFSKEDILLLVRLSGALMKNKDLMKEMVEKVHEKED